MNNNQQSFLDMIATSEGTIGIGDDGYNVLVGSTHSHPLLFSNYADHPRIYNKALNSTAAGRYQLLARWFDAYKKQLKLSDFSPPSQDKIAVQQIRECRALPDIDSGNFESAVHKCAHIWASLPGANYGQHENTMERLKSVYLKCGGTLA